MVLPFLKNILTDPCLSRTCPKISQWFSFTWYPGTFQTVAVQWVRLCVGPLRAKSQFPTCPLTRLSDISHHKPTGFQSQTLWVLVFPVQVFWAVEPNVGFGPFAPQGLFGYEIPPTCGLLHQAESGLDYISTPSTHLLVAFFISSLV